MIIQFLFTKVLILAALLAVAVVADVPYPTPAYPAYPKASYDYVRRSLYFIVDL